MASRKKSRQAGEISAAPPAEAAAPGDAILNVHALEQGAAIGFSAERDTILSQALPDGVEDGGVLPESEEAFYARDPFSADYADFLKAKGGMRRAAREARRVDETLRASLLEKPHLFPKPEEAAHRGAAAVWRSLKDQLRLDSERAIDESDATELQALERDLAARAALVSAVGKGIDMLLKRLRQRLSEAPPRRVPDPAPAPSATPPAEESPAASAPDDASATQAAPKAPKAAKASPRARKPHSGTVEGKG